jgi:hypothetical protein
VIDRDGSDRPGDQRKRAASDASSGLHNQPQQATASAILEFGFCGRSPRFSKFNGTGRCFEYFFRCDYFEYLLFSEATGENQK